MALLAAQVAEPAEQPTMRRAVQHTCARTLHAPATHAACMLRSQATTPAVQKPVGMCMRMYSELCACTHTHACMHADLGAVGRLPDEDVAGRGWDSIQDPAVQQGGGGCRDGSRPHVPHGGGGRATRIHASCACLQLQVLPAARGWWLGGWDGRRRAAARPARASQTGCGSLQVAAGGAVTRACACATGWGLTSADGAGVHAGVPAVVWVSVCVALIVVRPISTPPCPLLTPCSLPSFLAPVGL